jgi:predicted nucleotidyltransferase
VTIRIDPVGAAETGFWRATIEVAALFADLPWVIVGAQMVMLLERERGITSGRTTRDLDAIVDVRAIAGGSRAAASRLTGAGFEASAEHLHRFVRGLDEVDLLAPDHLGPRTDLTTVPPMTTVAIPGGSRALATRRLLSVDVTGAGSAWLPVPSVAGAIVLKVHAWQARQAPRDADDLVRLLDLVEDVEEVRDALKPAERRRLASILQLSDERSPSWRAARDPDNARAALARLSR